jgi:hypothetical protein
VDSLYNDEYNADMADYVEPKKSAMEQSLKKLFEKRKVDTTLNFFQIMPDSITKKISNPQLLKKMELEIHSDSLEEKMTMDFRISYKSMQECRQIYNQLGEAMYVDTGDTLQMSMMKSNMSQMDLMHFDPKKKTLTMKESKTEDNPNLKSFVDMGGEEKMDEEQLTMMLQMMGMDKLESIYHLPGKIKEVKGVQHFILDDNSVKIIVSVKDAILTGKTAGFTITYK